MLRALEATLDAWFLDHRRGDGSRVFVFDHGRKVWILIRHGMPFKREGSVKAGKSSSEYDRPEIHDVLIYDTEVDDIGVHAGTKGERDLYSEADRPAPVRRRGVFSSGGQVYTGSLDRAWPGRPPV